jgi:hypothetical protein
MSVRVSGTRVGWRVSVVDVGNGKVLASGDVGSELLQDVAMSDDVVVVADEKNRKVYRYGAGS